MSNMKLILGTMTFGEQLFGNDVRDMIEYFLSQGLNELDTAYVYNEGQCEVLIGQALSNISVPEVKISTKINPRITGKLDYDAVMSQFNKSISSLGVEKIDILYLHFPDPVTPVKSALEACAELYEDGKISQLGLSNFPAWMVAESYHVCKSHNWLLPRVYEGVYNPLSRHAERELNKALDYYGMCFYAYNPLAGGMLTNKYTGSNMKIDSGRFINRPNYQDRYWKESYFTAVNNIKEACERYHINIVDASYRWMSFHSMLNPDRGDGIIVGASRIEQLKQNISSVNQGELPEEVVCAFNNAWDLCRADAPEYFRFYTPKNN